jgi:hypothetical protein
MDSEFVFKLLNRVGPFDRLGLLVVIHEKVSNGLFQVLDTDKVIGLKQLALQDTEPDLQLIEPGGIRRQPTDVKRELTLHHCWLFLQPAFQLLRSVGGSIVQDQADRPYTALKRLLDDDLLHKGLKIGKGFARTAAAIDLPIGDTQSRKQVPGATTLIAGFLKFGPTTLRWARRLLPFSSLDRGFLIQTEQLGSLAPQALGVGVQLQGRTRPLQKAFGIMNVLPTVIAPGTQPLGFELPPDRTGRGSLSRKLGGHLASHLSPTPTRQGDAHLAGQGASCGGDLRAHFRGKTPRCSTAWGIPQPTRGDPATPPFAHHTITGPDGLSNALVLPVRMLMGG